MSEPASSPFVPIADVQERAIAMVQGRIISVSIEPADASPTLTARVEDPTGVIDAVFLGRREIPGLEPGQTVRLTGRVASTESVPRFFNPRYELVWQQ